MTKFKYITIFFTILAAIIFFQPRSVLAAVDAETADLTEINAGTYVCNPLPGQLVQAIINCISTPVRKAVLKPYNAGNPSESGLLALVSNYMIFLLSSLMTLAVFLYGLKVFNVRNNPYTVGLGLLLRIGIAMFLAVNLSAFGERLFAVFDEVVNIGNQGGVSIWLQIDHFLSDLLGFATGAPSNINTGIIALLSGSFFSKNLGVMLTIVGIFAIGTLLLFILQAMYLYLSSIIAFGFLLATGPIFIPFIIFNHTERFFTKWFNLMISTMLTPLLMFAFLGIFLDVPAIGAGPPAPGILRLTVENIFTELGNGNITDGKNYVQRCLRPAQPLVSSYLLPTDSNMYDTLACPPPLQPNCDQRDRFTSSTQSWMNPFLFRSFNYSLVTVPRIDCGINDAKIKEKVLMELMALFLYTAFINAMISRIPTISADISDGLSTGVSNLHTGLTSMAHMIRK